MLLPKKILLQALTIINFPDDQKEVFINKFAELCNKQFVSDLLNTLPEDKQKELIDKLAEEKDQQKINAILLENFNKEMVEETLKKSVGNTFGNYLNTIMPELSEEKKAELAEYFNSLSKEAQVQQSGTP